MSSSDQAELIPLSHLALDHAVPDVGWDAYLTGRGIPIVPDHIGRSAVSSVDARRLFDERREDEARNARLRAEAERQAVERDQAWRAQLHGGIPASMIPPGVAPAAAMMQAEKDSRPRRMTPLQEALSGESMTYHRFGSEQDDES